MIQQFNYTQGLTNAYIKKINNVRLTKKMTYLNIIEYCLIKRRLFTATKAGFRHPLDVDCIESARCRLRLIWYFNCRIR